MFDSVLADFDHECTATRRLLERLPDTGLDWRPHVKSFTIGELALHMSRLIGWGRSILDDDGYDLTTGGAKPPAPTSRAEVLAAFDAVVAAVRQSLVHRPAAHLSSVWELRRGAQVLMSMPRGTALRRFVIHHLIHHRGQLTVYLRLRDVPLPPLYGPTADERM